jgi:cell division septation protein DedD
VSERLEIDPDEMREHEEVAPSRRRLFPAALVTVAAIGVGYLSWWTYEHAKPPQIPSNVPVIHSDAAPIKEAPKNPGGMVVPDQDSVLLNHESGGAPKVEQLLPEPETALPRPAPPPKPTPPPEIASAPAKPAPQADAGASAASPSPPPAPVAAAPTAIAPATAAPAAAAAPAAPAVRSTPHAASTSSGYRLQLGAMRTEDAAKQAWQRLQKSQPDVLSKLGVTITRVQLGEKGVFYRIQAGPIADAADAARSCAALKSRNVGCILVKP